MLNTYLKKESIQIMDRVENVDQAITLCGQQLIDQGCIDERYVDSMKSTYAQYGPYMVLIDKVALFHGKPGVGVTQTAMSLTALKEPYPIPDHDKSIQLCFAFSSLDNQQHMEMIRCFAQLLMDTERLNALLEAKTIEEIYQIIQ